MRKEGRHKKRNSWINKNTLVPPTAVGRNVSQEKWDSIFNHKKLQSQEGDDVGHKYTRK